MSLESKGPGHGTRESVRNPGPIFGDKVKPSSTDREDPNLDRDLGFRGWEKMVGRRPEDPCRVVKEDLVPSLLIRRGLWWDLTVHRGEIRDGTSPSRQGKDFYSEGTGV